MEANEIGMDLVKLFQKKTEDGGEPYGKVQKVKPLSKNSQQPVKPKKAEGTKKPVKKSDEPRFDWSAWWSRARQYLREVTHELRKVVWPSRKETIGTTAVVLVIVIISAAYLGVVDSILSRLVRLLVG